MKLQYLLVKSRMRKLLIMNVVWATVFSFKRKDPLHTEERAVGFKGKNEFIIQLYEQFFLCVDLFLSILSGIISMLL